MGWHLKRILFLYNSLPISVMVLQNIIIICAFKGTVWVSFLSNFKLDHKLIHIWLLLSIKIVLLNPVLQTLFYCETYSRGQN